MSDSSKRQTLRIEGLGKVAAALATEGCQGTGRHDISCNVHVQITARWASAGFGRASATSQILRISHCSLESENLALGAGVRDFSFVTSDLNLPRYLSAVTFVTAPPA
jgi:hypothetical protein